MFLQIQCCSYSSSCTYWYFQCQIYCTFTLVLWEVCVTCPRWLFFVVPWFRSFSVCCSGIFWMTWHCYNCPYYDCRFLHFTFAELLLYGLHILESSRLLSSSHFCLPKLQHLLAHMFLFHYHGLWCLVYASCVHLQPSHTYFQPTNLLAELEG
jgi:hypothetical protein